MIEYFKKYLNTDNLINLCFWSYLAFIRFYFPVFNLFVDEETGYYYSVSKVINLINRINPWAIWLFWRIFFNKNSTIKYFLYFLKITLETYTRIQPKINRNKWDFSFDNWFNNRWFYFNLIIWLILLFGYKKPTDRYIRTNGFMNSKSYNFFYPKTEIDKQILIDNNNKIVMAEGITNSVINLALNKIIRNQESIKNILSSLNLDNIKANVKIDDPKNDLALAAIYLLFLFQNKFDITTDSKKENLTNLVDIIEDYKIMLNSTYMLYSSYLLFWWIKNKNVLNETFMIVVGGFLGIFYYGIPSHYITTNKFMLVNNKTSFNKTRKSWNLSGEYISDVYPSIIDSSKIGFLKIKPIINTIAKNDYKSKAIKYMISYFIKREYDMEWLYRAFYYLNGEKRDSITISDGFYFTALKNDESFKHCLYDVSFNNKNLSSIIFALWLLILNMNKIEQKEIECDSIINSWIDFIKIDFVISDKNSNDRFYQLMEDTSRIFGITDINSTSEIIRWFFTNDSTAIASDILFENRIWKFFYAKWNINKKLDTFVINDTLSLNEPKIATLYASTNSSDLNLFFNLKERDNILNQFIITQRNMTYLNLNAFNSDNIENFRMINKVKDNSKQIQEQNTKKQQIMALLPGASYFNEFSSPDSSISDSKYPENGNISLFELIYELIDIPKFGYIHEILNIDLNKFILPNSKQKVPSWLRSEIADTKSLFMGDTGNNFIKTFKQNKMSLFEKTWEIFKYDTRKSIEQIEDTETLLKEIKRINTYLVDSRNNNNKYLLNATEEKNYEIVNKTSEKISIINNKIDLIMNFKSCVEAQYRLWAYNVLKFSNRDILFGRTPIILMGIFGFLDSIKDLKIETSKINTLMSAITNKVDGYLSLLDNDLKIRKALAWNDIITVLMNLQGHTNSEWLWKNKISDYMCGIIKDSIKSIILNYNSSKANDLSINIKLNRNMWTDVEFSGFNHLVILDLFDIGNKLERADVLFVVTEYQAKQNLLQRKYRDYVSKFKINNDVKIDGIRNPKDEQWMFINLSPFQQKQVIRTLQKKKLKNSNTRKLYISRITLML